MPEIKIITMIIKNQMKLSAIRIKCTCSDWQHTFCRCVSVFRSYERFSFRLNFDLSAARCS